MYIILLADDLENIFCHVILTDGEKFNCLVVSGFVLFFADQLIENCTFYSAYRYGINQ